jgi:hypothetical protein
MPCIRKPTRLLLKEDDPYLQKGIRFTNVSEFLPVIERCSHSLGVVGIDQVTDLPNRLGGVVRQLLPPARFSTGQLCSSVTDSPPSPMR